jgi:hypothetical protein
MDLVTYDDYDQISERVRQLCAQKYVALIDNLQPYINGDFGDITPGHVSAYVSVVKELGRLYEAQKRPRDPEAMIPATKVAALLEAAEARIEAAVAQAVLETEQRVRRELEAREAGDVQAARNTVLARLGDLRRD